MVARMRDLTAKKAEVVESEEERKLRGDLISDKIEMRRRERERRGGGVGWEVGGKQRV